ncbi:hypothetical protein ACFOLD_06430 [Kocuria carniphila]|uniref:hypothetical protein n=1 Tax=Kocuria carniphila TaxID=262208 RepID=UPI0036167285
MVAPLIMLRPARNQSRTADSEVPTYDDAAASPTSCTRPGGRKRRGRGGVVLGERGG